LLVVRDRGGYEGRNDRYIDLRVDESSRTRPRSSGACSGCGDDTMLVRTDPPLRGRTAELVSEIQRRLAKVGRYDGPAPRFVRRGDQRPRSRSGPVGTTSRDVCATTVASPSTW
jgi:uncharacterized Ntn-hydrolase superfamily protein